MSDIDDRLRSLVSGEPPAGILALDETAKTSLADLLTETRTHQTQTLQESLNAALKHVPLPLRGVVKKVLIG
jgi:hypothetical protein